METGPQDWNFSCGVCHVGGGQLEYDRDRNSYSPSSSAGDYYYYSFDKNQIVPGYMSDTNKAEVDCLLCHLNNTDPNGISGAGRAWLQSKGCNGGNPIGPINDPTCSITGYDTMYHLAGVGPFTPGTNYDMYNRNLALKTESLQYAASLGIGAKVSSWGGKVQGVDGNYNVITGITGVPSTISAANIATTPNSQNCAACHARDDNTAGVPGMLSTVRFGYGNYFSIKPAGTAIDQNAANGKNDVRWIEMGCKTGIGKRGQKIGAGPNDKWGMSLFNVMFGLNRNPGTPITTETIPVGSPMMQAFGFTSVSTKERIPDQDVHDAAGIGCATCHYAIGSKFLTGAASLDGFIANNPDGSVTFPADTNAHGLNTASGETGQFGINYPAETVYGIDHQFAQGDALKDTYGKNNLDGSVSCESCHITRTHPRVVNGTLNPPIPTHPAFPAFHIQKIACQTCHIPEVYIAPFRLKNRDWSTGQWKKGNETDGGFKNLLDFQYDLITGSHSTIVPLHQWSTKYEEKKIYPVMASEMPIWVKLNNLSTTLPNTAITNPTGYCSVTMTQACDATHACPGGETCTGADDTSAIKTCSYGSRIFAQCATDADCPGGYCKPGVTAYAAPAKSRDVINAAVSIDTSGILRRPSGNMNGANLVPLFDGWPLSDAQAIDTAARIDAMSNAGAGEILKIFHANFDVTHEVVPKEWALGGSKRGGCVSCHSSANPIKGYDAQGHPIPNLDYSPNSVGFFEGIQHVGIGPNLGFNVGQHDLLKNPFNLFADFDCTAYCGLGMPGNDDAKYFDQSGNPISGATCGDGNPAHHPYGWATIDSCVSFMQGYFDQLGGFPSGTSRLMGFNDGIAGLQGFTLRETVSGSTLGCQPFTGAASIASMMGFPVNVNNCMPANNRMFTMGSCVGATQQMPGQCDQYSFRYKGMCFTNADCNGVMWPAAEYAKNPNGLLLTRGEARSRNKLEMQQGRHLGFDGVVAAEGVNQLWWPILTEQNPSNPNHKWAWDQAGAANVCGALQNEPCCTSPMTGQPVSCSQGMDVRTGVHANQFLGYDASTLAALTVRWGDVSYPVTFNIAPAGLSVTVTSNVDCGTDPTTGLPIACPAFSYDWDWGDGSAHGTAASASHTYASAGTKSITLLVYLTTGGRVGSYTRTVSVTAPDYPPTASATCSWNANTWTMTVTDTSTDTDVSPVQTVVVTWGDGQTSVISGGAQAVHTYTTISSYTPTVRAIDTALQSSSTVNCTGNAPVTPGLFSITGSAKNAANTLNLSSALVTLRKGSATGPIAGQMSTNMLGSFTFTNLKPATYYIVVSKSGYTFGAAPSVTVGPNSSGTVIHSTN